MAYSADTFVADEQPTTAKWNKLWSNDASFNDGTGIADNAIINRHMNDDSVTGDNLSLDSTEYQLASAFTTSSTSYVDSGIKVTLAAAGTWLMLGTLRGDSSGANQFGVVQIYNQTTATAETDAESITCFNSAGSSQTTMSIVKRVVTTTTNNILRINFKSGGAYTVGLLADASGRSRLLAIRIG